MRIRLNVHLKNEKGSGTTVFMVGMVLAALFLAIIFFDFSTIFVNKRVTQTGADAAALAAAKSSTISMREELKEETQEELDELGERWEDFLEAANAPGEPPAEGEPPPPAPTTDELLKDFIEMVERQKGKNMPGSIKRWLLNHSVSVEAEEAMKFFFSDAEVSDMSCKAVRDNLAEAREEAEKFAERNDNDRVIDFQFIPGEFRMYVETDRKGKYTTVSDEGVPAISSESSARIGEPAGFDISCS